MTQPRENNVWLFLELMARRRGMIIGLTLLATVVAAVISLVLPKWYQAEALLLPPKDVSTTMESLSRLEEVISVTGGLNLPVMVTPSDVYARILRSRTISDRISAQFDLQQRYETATRTETYDALMKHAVFRVTEEGLLSIQVEDKVPETAAVIANAFVDEINRVNQEIVTGRARKNREFIEGRLNQVRTELDSARASLEHFQRTYRTVDFDEQTRLAIEQASNLKVSLAQTELDLQIAEQSLGKDHPDLMVRRQRRAILKQQLERLEVGGADSSYFSLPVASIPALRGQYEMLYSKVRVSEVLFNTLLEQLEQAKIQESKESPTISVLDRASVPELRSRPKRTLIVGGTFLLSLIFSIFLASLFEYMDRLQERRPEDHERAQYVAGAFFGWLPGVKRNSRGSTHSSRRDKE